MNWAVIGPLIDKLLAVADDAEVTLCNTLSGTILACNPATKWEQRFYRSGSVEQALRDALTDYGMWELV